MEQGRDDEKGLKTGHSMDTKVTDGTAFTKCDAKNSISKEN